MLKHMLDKLNMIDLFDWDGLVHVSTLGLGC